jgi:hypothetical protein
MAQPIDLDTSFALDIIELSWVASYRSYDVFATTSAQDTPSINELTRSS